MKAKSICGLFILIGLIDLTCWGYASIIDQKSSSMLENCSSYTSNLCWTVVHGNIDANVTLSGENILNIFVTQKSKRGLIQWSSYGPISSYNTTFEDVNWDFSLPSSDALLINFVNSTEPYDNAEAEFDGTIIFPVGNVVISKSNILRFSPKTADVAYLMLTTGVVNPHSMEKEYIDFDYPSHSSTTGSVLIESQNINIHQQGGLIIVSPQAQIAFSRIKSLDVNNFLVRHAFGKFNISIYQGALFVMPHSGVNEDYDLVFQIRSSFIENLGLFLDSQDGAAVMGTIFEDSNFENIQELNLISPLLNYMRFIDSTFTFCSSNTLSSSLVLQTANLTMENTVINFSGNGDRCLTEYSSLFGGSIYLFATSSDSLDKVYSLRNSAINLSGSGNGNGGSFVIYGSVDLTLDQVGINLTSGSEGGKGGNFYVVYDQLSMINSRINTLSAEGPAFNGNVTIQPAFKHQ